MISCEVADACARADAATVWRASAREIEGWLKQASAKAGAHLASDYRRAKRRAARDVGGFEVDAVYMDQWLRQRLRRIRRGFRRWDFRRPEPVARPLLPMRWVNGRPAASCCGEPVLRRHARALAGVMSDRPAASGALPRPSRAVASLAIAVLILGVWPAPLIDVMDASIGNLVEHIAVTKL